MTRRIDNRPGKARRLLPAAALAAAGGLALTGCADGKVSANQTTPAPAAASQSPLPQHTSEITPTTAETQKITQELSDQAKALSAAITSNALGQGKNVTVVSATDGISKATNEGYADSATASGYTFSFHKTANNTATVTIHEDALQDVQINGEAMPMASYVEFTYSLPGCSTPNTTCNNLNSSAKNGGIDAQMYANTFQGQADLDSMTLTAATFSNGEGTVGFTIDAGVVTYANNNFSDSVYDFPADLSDDNAEQILASFTGLATDFNNALNQ